MEHHVWKGHLTFGLISLPVKLQVAARSESLSFNQLHKADHSRVKQVLHCACEDKPISRDEIVKGYEYKPGKWVTIDQSDIDRVAPSTAKTMELLEFVPAAEVDPVFLESSYFVAPEEAGAKAYALLYEALKQTAMVGIAKVAMHMREHIVILRPGPRGLLLHTMYYRNEVRAASEYSADPGLVGAAELDLCTALINARTAAFQPDKYRDEYRAALQQVIDEKAEVVEPAPGHLAPVIDIMDAIRQTLGISAESKETLKKPVRGARKAAATA